MTKPLLYAIGFLLLTVCLLGSWQSCHDMPSPPTPPPAPGPAPKPPTPKPVPPNPGPRPTPKPPGPKPPGPNPAPGPADPDRELKIVRVEAADLLIAGGKILRRQRIRLSDIEAPRRFQQYGREGVKFVEDQLAASGYTVKISGNPGIVTTTAGVVINAEVVRAGWAQATTDKYAVLEKQARAQKAGMWSMEPAELIPEREDRSDGLGVVELVLCAVVAVLLLWLSGLLKD